jgi:hypothetical protein
MNCRLRGSTGQTKPNVNKSTDKVGRPRNAPPAVYEAFEHERRIYNRRKKSLAAIVNNC